MLGRNDFDGAISVFLFNVKQHPQSANVYDSLGEAYENAGRSKEALAAYSSAVETARGSGDDRLGIFTTNRDRMREQLEQETEE